MAKRDKAPSSSPRGRPRGDAGTPLDRAGIAAAGLALLDRCGLAAFSVRDLAKELGVYPASIYWHVGSRNGLLADMVAHVLRNVAPPSLAEQPRAWQDWIRLLFRRYRDAIRGHPGIAPLIGAQLVSNAGSSLELTERILAVLLEAGFRDDRLVEAFSVVVAAQVGFVTLEFAPLPAENRAEWTAGMQALIASVDARDHPILAGHLPRMANRSFILRWENGTTQPLDQAFTLYVEILIAGLERLAGQPGG